MKKIFKKITLIVVLLIPNFLYSQIVFDTIIGNSKFNSYVENVLIDNNKNIILVGTKGIYPNYNGYILQLNEIGTLENEVELINDNEIISLEKLIDVDTGYIFVGRSGLNKFCKIKIYSCDYNYNINWQKKYELFAGDTIIEQFFGCIKNKDNEIVIFGSAGLNPFFDARPFVFKLNLEGDSLYLEKGYDYMVNQSTYIFDLDTIPKADKYLVSSYEFREDPDPWECDIVKYDKFFNIDTIFRPIPLINSTYDAFWGNSQIKFISDTTFLYAARKLIFGKKLNQEEEVCVQLYDTAFNLYKEVCWGADGSSMDYFSYWGLDYIEKTAIYVGGTSPIDGGQYDNYFMLTKLNENLNIVWTKFYGGNASYRLNHVIPTNDGGCLMVGKYFYADTMSYDDIILIKVDADGNSSLTSNIKENPQSLVKDIIVYPNPTSNIINFRKGQQIQQAIIEIYDINGKLIIQREFVDEILTIDLNNNQKGIHIYKIFNKNNLIDSGKIILNN